MAQTVVYIVKSGDWLAKIAEEHDTTVDAIWNHPENAALRAQRGSPDVLYPGDVLRISIADAAPPVQPSPAEPPGLPAPPVPAASEDPSWPYEPDSGVPIAKPTWECPGGTCVCHPPPADEPRCPHVIVFYDPQGKRMPGARCRVYEQGRLITEEPATTDGAGELTLEIRASTSTLEVEWAPADLPRNPSLPYRKRYHVRLGEDSALAAERRLSNLGFGRRRRREDNVRDYQRAFAEVETGNIRDVQAEVIARHDGGMLPMFAPQPPAAGMPHAIKHANSFLPASWQTTAGGGGAPLVPRNRTSAEGQAAAETPATESPAADTGDQNPQGAVVAEAGHVWVIVGLEPDGDLLNPKDLHVRLCPLDVPSKPKEEEKPPQLVPPTGEPHVPPEGNGRYVLFVFSDLPLGRYAALVHIDKVEKARNGYALGSAEVDVKIGLCAIVYVGATIHRPICSVEDPLLDLDVPVMQRRRKVLATIKKHLPQSADYQASKKRETPPYNQGEFKPMYALVEGKFQNTCATINNSLMDLAGSVLGIYGAKLPKNPGWTEYANGLIPSVGDSLYLEHDDGTFNHCGIVVRSSLTSNEAWLTADGGQPTRTTEFRNGPEGWRRYYGLPHARHHEAAYIVPRLIRHRSSNRPSFSNVFIFPGTPRWGDYVLRGWVDITHPDVPFRAVGYDKSITEKDYLALKKLATEIRVRVAVDRVECAFVEEMASRPPAQGTAPST